MQLAKQKALVIGGNRGMGRGIGMALAQEGADVALTYAHHADEAKTVVEQIQSLGRKALAAQLDLANPAQIRRVVPEIISEMGHLDILVNNAGVVLRKSFLEVTDEEWDEVLNVNFKGVWLCSQIVARHMMERRSGKIVNMSSGVIVRAGPRMGVYAASKAALHALSKGMAHDLAPYGIRVNAIAPGLIQTPGSKPTFDDPVAFKTRLSRIPMGRPGQPEDIGGVAVFLCSDASRYMTGTSSFVDGGSTMGN